MCRCGHRPSIAFVGGLRRRWVYILKWDLLSIVISCGVVFFVFCTEHVFVCGRHALSGNDCVTITGDRFKVFAVSSTVMICYEYYHYANTTIY